MNIPFFNCKKRNKTYKPENNRNWLNIKDTVRRKWGDKNTGGNDN